VGQSITLPSIITSSNSATTFKPYNAGQIVGSTTPNLPTAPPPPPSSSGCSGLAEMLVVAVAIVVTIYTAGAAAEAFGAAEVGGSTLATGAAALGGTLTATGAGIAGAVVGGVAGSVAGQLTGDALGVSQGFSLEQALTSGLAAGLTAGIGGEISSSGEAVLANAKGVLTPTGAALFGAGAYASGVAADKVTGEATHFSWAGVAASAVASGITAAAGLKGEPLQQVGDSAGSFTQDVAGGLLSGGLTRETSQLLGDNHVSSWQQIGEDAFGNALGNAAISAMETSPTPLFSSSFNFATAGTGVGTAGDALASYNPSDFPMLASSDAYSTYTGSYGLPDSTSDSSTPDTGINGWPIVGQQMAPNQTMEDVSQASTVNVKPTAEEIAAAGLDDASGSGGVGTASPQYLMSYSSYFSNDALDQQRVIQQQLMDVLPGSPRWAELKQQEMATGAMSSDPVVMANANMAAMELHIGQVQQEVQYGGRPMSTVEDATPSLLAQQAQQRQLNGLGLFLLGTSAPAMFARGSAEAPALEPAPYMNGSEPVSFSTAVPSTTAVDASDQDMVLVYRGTNRVAENNIYNETGNLLSDAGQQSYMQTGSLDSAYAASDATHQDWIDMWGSEDQYAQAHAEFGAELSPAFGMDKTFISVTTDPAQADYFSNGGTIYSGYVPRSSLVQQTLSGSGESEFLLRNGTNLLTPVTNP